MSLASGPIFRRACDPARRALERSANQFETRCLAHAGRARTGAVQARRTRAQQRAAARSLRSLREIKRGRADVAPRYLLHVESTLAQVGAPARRPASTAQHARSPRKRRLSWSILRCSKRISRCRRSSASRKSGTARRCMRSRTASACSPAARRGTSNVLPLGPAQLARALRHATRCLDLGVEYRVLTYRLFDRVAMMSIGDFYEVVNGYLAKQRILAHLAVALGAHARREHGSTRRHAGGRAQGRIRCRANAGAGAVPGAAGCRRHARFRTFQHAAHAALRSTAYAGPDRARRDGYLASRDDLQSVLGTLQRSGDGGAMRDGKPRDAATLRQDMLMQLRQASPQGRPPVLAEEDSDTVDLVGMLFDYINRSVRAAELRAIAADAPAGSGVARRAQRQDVLHAARASRAHAAQHHRRNRYAMDGRRRRRPEPRREDEGRRQQPLAHRCGGIERRRHPCDVTVTRRSDGGTRPGRRPMDTFRGLLSGPRPRRRRRRRRGAPTPARPVRRRSRG